MKANYPARWNNLPDDYLLTRAEVSAVLDVSASTLCAHSYAGLLPFIPGRPVHIRVGDLKVYMRMFHNGTRSSLHPSMRIEHADRQAYSPLHGVAEFTHGDPEKIITRVVSETR